MPVRLVKPYGTQSAGALYWGVDQATLRAVGIADDNIEDATDYVKGGDRIVTEALANVSLNATTYRMNSATAQTLNFNQSGHYPKDTTITVIQMGAGATTITAGVGVTITPGNGLTGLVTQGANRVATLIKGAGETWTAIGALGT